jgi:hypothetical protein
MRASPEVKRYIDGIASETRRRDAATLLELMGRVTGERATMWGSSIVAFGTYHYRYESGREGDAPAAGFAPRKAATTIYLPEGVGAHEKLLARLGEHTTGVACLYLKNLDQVDLDVLERIIDSSYGTVTSGTFGQRARESST